MKDGIIKKIFSKNCHILHSNKADHVSTGKTNFRMTDTINHVSVFTMFTIGISLYNNTLECRDKVHKNS